MEQFLNQVINQTLYGKQDSDSHLMALFGIALSLRPKLILELGVRYGDTTMPLMLAAKLLDAQMTSVDINSTKFSPSPEFRNNWHFVQSDAIKFLSDAVERNINYDLVFVDDWHSYTHVKRELELLDKLTTPSSVILLHDLMYGGTHPYYHSELDTTNPEWADGGPYRAVNELDKKKWEFATIPTCNGLTLLRKKS